MADFTESTNQKTKVLTSSLPLEGECVTFTGTLASMSHREAAGLVQKSGGRAVHSVSRALTMLVVGEEGWPLEEDGEPSQKLRHVTQLVADDTPIRIVQESDWLHLIGLNERRDEIQRSYTPAMLDRLLNVPVNIIRRWARVGLIHAVRRVGRLPYFDYREVASVQRLARLLEEGIRADVLENSLAELSRTLLGTDRSLAQLTLLAQDDKVLLRDSHGVLNPRTGQRLLDFEPDCELKLVSNGEEEEGPIHDGISTDIHEDVIDTEDDEPISISFAEAKMRLDDRSMDQWHADEWFNEGCRLAEENSFQAAVNAFRNCLSLLASDHVLMQQPTPTGTLPEEVFPDPADVQFHLADALYRSGQTAAAIERYYCAIEYAPDFIEAWTQLGCLQTEQKCWPAAEEALLTAISIHDANPDALLHYAQLLDQMDRETDAVTYWEQYLQHDSRGPWADHARKRLQQSSVTVELNEEQPGPFGG